MQIQYDFKMIANQMYYNANLKYVESESSASPVLIQCEPITNPVLESRAESFADPLRILSKSCANPMWIRFNSIANNMRVPLFDVFAHVRTSKHFSFHNVACDSSSTNCWAILRIGWRICFAAWLIEIQCELTWKSMRVQCEFDAKPKGLDCEVIVKLNANQMWTRGESKANPMRIQSGSCDS